MTRYKVNLELEVDAPSYNVISDVIYGTDWPRLMANVDIQNLTIDELGTRPAPPVSDSFTDAMRRHGLRLMLGFDPTNPDEYPYQAHDDGFTFESLDFDPATEERLGDLDPINTLRELLSNNMLEPLAAQFSELRTLELALRFFLKLCTHPPLKGAFDPRVNGMAHFDIFTAALDTALIWERG